MLDYTKTTLLVTAHPDDECMFFGPTLQRFHRDDIYILCLSTGNADGLGTIREGELFKSGLELGVQPDNIACLDHPEFLDGLTGVWNTDEIAAFVDGYAVEHGIEQILTFDEHGVSGHPNHIDTFRGVMNCQVDVPIFSLDTVNLFRKYIGIADYMLATCTGEDPVLTTDVWGSFKAMMAHRSQLVWFRCLYVAFSRYMLINTWNKAR